MPFVPIGKLALPPGGTTGQVMRKRSATDFDVEWGPAGTSGTPGAEYVTDDELADAIEAGTQGFVTAGALQVTLQDYLTASGFATFQTQLGFTLAAKADLVGGKIPTSQIPAIATTETVPVASQAAMLALTNAQVQKGDVAIRTDTSAAFMLTVEGGQATLSNWAQLNTPGATGITQINGQTGPVVNLGKGDVGLGLVPNVAPSAVGASLYVAADAAAARAAIGAAAAGTSAPSLPEPVTPLPVLATPTRTVNVTNRTGLLAALGDLRWGDRISLAAGQYGGSSNIVVTAPSMTGYSEENPPPGVHIIGPAAKTAVLNRGATSSGYALHLDRANYVQIENLTITGGEKGVMADETNFARLINCDVGNTGHEGVHFRNNSSDNLVQGCTVHHCGSTNAEIGEGIYFGTATSNWSASYSRTGGQPDKSDRNTAIGNTISNVTAEPFDVKEGTTGGVIRGNTMDGGAIAGANNADSYMDIKGNDYLIEGNTGVNPSTFVVHGIETHINYAGFGNRNVFKGNTLAAGGKTGAVSNSPSGSQGINILLSGSRGSATGNVVYDDNTATGIPGGLTNVPVTPATYTAPPATATVTAANITDATTVGRNVLKAADQAAARSAIGAGTSSLALGTTGTTAAAGNDSRLSDARTPTAHTHLASDISDSGLSGREILRAADAQAVRNHLAFTSSVDAIVNPKLATKVGSADSSILQAVKITQAAYDALATKVATTLYVIVG